MPATLAAWGGATLTVTVSGTDITCDVIQVTVDRGRNRVFDPPDAGTCQIVASLMDGLSTSTGAPGAIVTVDIEHGTTSRRLFTGRVQAPQLHVLPRDGDQLVLECVDEFETLGRVNRRADPALDTPVGGGESVPQRITRWLDEAGSTSDRDLDSSTYTCPETLIDGNVLAQIKAAALADGGDFLVTGDGTLRFMQFGWRNVADTPVAYFSDRRLHDWVPYSTASLNNDLDEVQNDVSGTRRPIEGEATAPVPQRSFNSSSITTYGERGDALDELELEFDAQVADRVAAVITIAAQPNPRFDAIAVQPAFDPARSWPRTIPVTIGDLIGANRVWPDGTETALLGHVLAETWTFTPVDATVEYRCSGTGTWDAERGPRSSPLERCPDGTLKVKDGYVCDMTADVIIRDADGEILVTYPPGSLCECGVVEIPEGGVELCLDDGVHPPVCQPIDDPRLDAILWLDVEEPSSGMIERIDGDPIDGDAAFADTEVDVIPGDFDAINASDLGGQIAHEHSDHVEAASLDGGWTIDFWLKTDADTFTDDTTIINIGPVRVGLTLVGPPDHWEITVITIDEDLATNLSGPLVEVPDDGDWHHWVIAWDTSLLAISLDGATPTSHAWAHVPAAPSGDWSVSLPGFASIGEVLVYAAATVSGDPWDTPVAPTGTTVSVATTWIAPASYIESGGLSMLVPAAGTVAFKMIFRTNAATPPSSITAWRFSMHLDRNADGSYTDFITQSVDVGMGTWYGPGTTLPEGLVLPADAAALYLSGWIVNASFSHRFGTALVNIAFDTNGGANVWWLASTTTLRNQERYDDAATTTLPLLPDQLPP